MTEVRTTLSAPENEVRQNKTGQQILPRQHFGSSLARAVAMPGHVSSGKVGLGQRVLLGLGALTTLLFFVPRRLLFEAAALGLLLVCVSLRFDTRAAAAAGDTSSSRL